MPDRIDLAQIRQKEVSVGLSETNPSPCMADWQRRRAEPVIGRARHAAPQTFLLLLISFFAVASSRGQSPSSTVNQVHDHLERGQAALNSNDLEIAAKEFHEVLALDPKNAEAYANLGVLAFLKHDYPDASQYLRSALEIDPSLVKTEALLGICEKRLGKSSAQGRLEKSFPRLKDKKLQIQVGMELAGIYEQQGNLERSASVLQSLVDLDPDNVDILYRAHRIYSELADDTLDKLALLAPGSAQMQKVIAERLVNGGDLKGAVEHYRRALEINPHLPGVHFELGEALWLATPKDPDAQAAAEKEFTAAIRTEGDSAAVECEFGTIAFLRSDLASAQDHFERAYLLNHEDTQAQLGLGKVLMSTRKPKEAVKFLRLAVQSDPLNTEAHYRLGMAYKELKMADESNHELQLFQEIRAAKDRVRQLYRQMNKQSRTLDEQLAGVDQ